MIAVKEILGEELYAKVQAKLGSDKGLIIDDGMLIPKHRFDCINLSLKEHKKLAADLKAELEMMTDKLKEQAVETAKYARLEREFGIIKLVVESKPKNYAAVRSIINVGSLSGQKLERSVKKQLGDLKKSEPYLFYDAERLYRLVPIDQAEFTELKL